MKTSTEGLMALVGHEGIVLSRYKDSVGVPTIGIGHTKAAGNPDPATFKGELMLSEAFGLFRHDIMKYEAAVNKAVKVPLKQHEFDALVSFHYNTGAIAKASLVKSLNAGNKAKAGLEFMNWVKPKEIKPRRASEQKLFLTGQYPAPFATIYPATPSGSVQWSKGRRVDLRKELSLASPIPTPSPAPAPAQDGVKPDVILVDGPKKDETTVVVVPTPQNAPASAPVPSSKTGFAALAAIVGAVAVAAYNYFVGG